MYETAVALIVAVLSIGWVETDGCRAGKTMIRSGSLTPFDKKLILDVHNHYRAAVATGHIHGQPGAQNMLELKWDDELAARAQYWAEQCVNSHDPHRHVTRFSVGQNIGAQWTTRRPIDLHSAEPDFATRIGKWFGEVHSYGYSPMQHGGAHTGHYSQLIWSETSLVGCGYAFYFDPSLGYTKLYICNYGPGGNVIGSTPYVVGQPACPNFGLVPSSHYPGLCDYSYQHFVRSNYIG